MTKHMFCERNENIISSIRVQNHYVQQHTSTLNQIRPFPWFGNLNIFARIAWTPKLTNWENHSVKQS